MALNLKLMTEPYSVENSVELEIGGDTPILRSTLKRERVKRRLDSAPILIVDCWYDDLMRPGELRSRNSQIIFCYAASVDKNISRPLRLSVVNATGALEDFLRRVQKEGNWSADITKDSLEELIEQRILDPSKLLYLSADAEEEMVFYSQEYTYIIGGLVDRNHHKGIALKRAQALGIRAMKLPLRKYCTLIGSIVMSINHIFQLLVQLHNGTSFEDAVRLVIPRRKQV